MRQLFLLIAISFELVHSCARTSSVGTSTVATVTTAVPTTVTATNAATTTTIATTTTVATTTTASCGMCDKSTVNLNTADPNDVNSHNPTSMDGSPQNGCQTWIIICTPVNNNPTSLLTFQGGLGGPAEGNPATATLVCNGMNQWTYTMAGITTVITEVDCFG